MDRSEADTITVSRVELDPPELQMPFPMLKPVPGPGKGLDTRT